MRILVTVILILMIQVVGLYAMNGRVVFWSENHDDMLAAQKVHADYQGEIDGLSVVSSLGYCTIYAPRPEGQFDSYKLDTLGHELFHCFDLEFHDEDEY